MLLNPTSSAVSFSIIVFFAAAIIGWFKGFSQLTCCKRAVVAAVIMYVFAYITSKIINNILTSAFIESQLKQQKEPANDSRN